MRTSSAALALLAVQGSIASPLGIGAVGNVSVDLGYAIYEGSQDSKNGINVFKGYLFIPTHCHWPRELTGSHRIRYAAPPLGNLRFAAPQSPPVNRTAPIPALTDAPACPQTGAGIETPKAYGFGSALGDEDCLYLNVYAPSNATDLPVFFWIRKSQSKPEHLQII